MFTGVYEIAIANEIDVGQIAVDFVGAGEYERRSGVTPSQCIEQRERPACIDVEISERLGHARRNRNLTCQMKHGIGVCHRIFESALVPDIGDSHVNAGRMASF